MAEFLRVKQTFFFLPAAQAPATEPVWQPAADVYRTRGGWTVKFELAGVRPADIQLTVRGPRLTVRGVRRDTCLEDDCYHYQMEIAYSHFERSVELPVSLDRAELSAEHRDGMLLVHVRPEAGR